MNKRTTRSIDKELRELILKANTITQIEDREVFLDKEWIAVDNLIKELDKVWNKINKCKMDRVRANFITKTQVAYYIGELRKELNSLSNDKGKETYKVGNEYPNTYISKQTKED